MVSGSIALFLLLLAVILIVLFTGKFKVNAFIVLIMISFIYGLLIGMAPLDVIGHIKNGFGETLSSIGIVIIAGTIIGVILEKTGAVLSMTRAILKIVGKERSALAMSIAGYAVSIPVSCDSAYVILTPLNKSLAKESGTSMAVMAAALATGLYATHTMVPPTPGPVAAANALGADLGMVILFGLIAAIPAMIAGYLWARKFAKRYQIETDTEESHTDLISKYGRLPPAVLSFLPLLIPIVLILLKSIADLPAKPFGTGGFGTFVSFIGDPVSALIIGVLFSLLLVKKNEIGTAAGTWMTSGVKNAAIILAITGAGGSFGRILQYSPMEEFIRTNMAGLKIGIFLPFIISAALKTAQGSSMAAIITTASIMAPLLTPLGLNPALTVIAVGAGSMVISHANDPYFWVVSQLSNMPVNTAYKAYTSAAAVEGLAAMVVVAALSLFF
ncbi:GntP family permease [Treponema sp. OttesenSCG-928-L16]|nr:GntP family permease [Treponema sp. OttesenSCG-928-L16]